jgi:hypothetical protein
MNEISIFKTGRMKKKVGMSTSPRAHPDICSLIVPVPFSCPYPEKNPFCYTQRIINRSNKLRSQLCPISSFKSGFSKPADDLHPTENLFDSFSQLTFERLFRRRRETRQLKIGHRFDPSNRTVLGDPLFRGNQGILASETPPGFVFPERHHVQRKLDLKI